ncbi:MAG: HalOD1 output domain-containing protein [Haloarculaceae archaeon]
MSAGNGELYILRPDEGAADDGAWVTPQPAREVILREVAAAVDADADDFDDLDAYVDPEELAAVFDRDDGPGSVSFEVEDHAVTVEDDGTVAVDPAED